MHTLNFIRLLQKFEHQVAALGNERNEGVFDRFVKFGKKNV